MNFKEWLNEGAWGHGPLDNDDASDWKWKIGEKIINEIEKRMSEERYDHKYEAVGMWDFIKEALKTTYGFFTQDMEDNMNQRCLKAIEQILSNPKKLINQYKNPEEVKSRLLEIREKIK